MCRCALSFSSPRHLCLLSALLLPLLPHPLSLPSSLPCVLLPSRAIALPLWKLNDKGKELRLHVLHCLAFSSRTSARCPLPAGRSPIRIAIDSLTARWCAQTLASEKEERKRQEERGKEDEEKARKAMGGVLPSALCAHIVLSATFSHLCCD